MSMEHEIVPSDGARKRSQRVGRGDGSRRGNYSGRGVKGQGARGGKPFRPGFEGGQTPLIKKLPRQRGFTNVFRVEYEEVNVGDIEQRFEAGSTVTPARLAAAGLVRRPKLPVKVLGSGELSKPLTVIAQAFTASAREKISAAGGTAEDLT